MTNPYKGLLSMMAEYAGDKTLLSGMWRGEPDHWESPEGEAVYELPLGAVELREDDTTPSGDGQRVYERVEPGPYMQGPCGCILGTFAPVIETSSTSGFIDERARRDADVATWLDQLGLPVEVAREIEKENDRFESEDNAPDACARRWAHMFRYLGAKAEAWDADHPAG